MLCRHLPWSRKTRKRINSDVSNAWSGASLVKYREGRSYNSAISTLGVLTQIKSLADNIRLWDAMVALEIHQYCGGGAAPIGCPLQI